MTAETGVLQETDDQEVTIKHDCNAKLPPREYKLVWRNIILYIYLHVSALYGLYAIFASANWRTALFGLALVNLGNLGITAGVHRLWAHRSYKAKFPLRAFLVFLQTLAFQGSVIEWARDHRVHHKYSETDADPHNAKRGLFYSHVGWLLTKKHPEVFAKGKGIDYSDLTEDSLLKFQHKHYVYLMVFTSFFLPTFLPCYLWGETFLNAFFINMLRYCCGLNITWLVNSAAHFFGDKPYDRFINPVENKHVSFLALGEGWHNYHHTFPWDYKTSEYGYRLNPTAIFINCMAYIGQAYDLKSVSTEMIKKRVKRTGDGTHELWGWGDKDQSSDEQTEAVISHKRRD